MWELSPESVGSVVPGQRVVPFPLGEHYAMRERDLHTGCQQHLLLSVVCVCVYGVCTCVYGVCTCVCVILYF